MAAVDVQPTPGEVPMCARLRYTVPDLSVPAEERSFFAFPASKSVEEIKTELKDARTATDIVHGPAGLDVQGFAYINHRSALHDTGDAWFEGTNIEDIYIPEIERLVCEVTGAKRAIVSNTAFRRRLADKQQDPKFFLRKGCDLDNEIAKLPRDVGLVYGKQVGGALEPAKSIHCDYTTKGLRASARFCRKDICALAQPALDAEDAKEETGNGEVPRYAAYSVWRPVKPVKRDPLAVCDWRSIEPTKEVVGAAYRALSDVTESGEYLLESSILLPPQPGRQHRWYWVPEQKPDEVLMIKFADTQSELDPAVAGGCQHTSPDVLGTEGEDARCSIECRVLAFW